MKVLTIYPWLFSFDLDEQPSAWNTQCLDRVAANAQLAYSQIFFAENYKIIILFLEYQIFKVKFMIGKF